MDQQQEGDERQRMEEEEARRQEETLRRAEEDLRRREENYRKAEEDLRRAQERFEAYHAAWMNVGPAALREADAILRNHFRDYDQNPNDGA